MRRFSVAGLLGPRTLMRAASLVAIVFSAGVALFATGVDAQQNNNSLQQILQQLPGTQGISGANGTGSTIDQTQQQQQPTVLLPDLASPPLPTSRLERILSNRAGANLKQFGYDQVGKSTAVRVPESGAIQDNYILGPGDEIVVTFRGQENSEYRFTVNSGGQITLPRLSPIMAAGRTLGDFRQAVQAAVQRGYVSTQAFVTVGQLRQASVIVAGEVNNPGVRIVTGLSTPLDAILLSGGVKKTGSLRNIKLVHAGRTTIVDLYSVLAQAGRASSALLSDGDKIIVPSLGKTVAISGWVRRPGIYELSAFDAASSVRRLIALAGGLEVRGRYRMTLIHAGQDGSNVMSAATETTAVHDSDVLIIQPAADQTENRAILSGSTPLAGVYSVNKATTLADVLRAPGALGTAPYTLFGAISRRDPQNQMRTMIPFTPVAVLNGTENVELENHDIVRVFSVNETRLLTAVAAAFVNRRAASESAMLTPESVLQSLGAPAPQPSNASAAAAGAGASGASSQTPLLQGPTTDQTTLNQRNGVMSDRQNIAELSTMLLGDGGVLVPNPLLFSPGTAPPAPAGSAASAVQAQQLAAMQQQQRQAALQTMGTQGAIQFQTNQAASQSQAVQQQLGTAQSSMPVPTGPDYGYQNNPNLPANLQEQSVATGSVATNQEVQTFGDLARQLDIDPLVLMNFLLDNQVTVSGAVRSAGSYFVGGHADLKDVVAAAGGTDHWVDENSVEVISTAIDPSKGVARTERNLVPLRSASLGTYIIKPHDEIRLNKIYTTVGAGSVTLRGQVRNPGTFQIERGERLSELLLRAGGLTDVAYPYGTVFLRKSAAEIERQGYERMASELQDVFLSGMTRVGSGAISPTTFTSVQGFIKDLHDTPPLGRISIIADPALLASDTTRDPLLEPGDIIYIPQRPSTVTVLGQVMQQGSFAFDSKMTAKDYIARAGGPGEFADTSLTFLVLPDGTARRVESSWFDLNSENIPPGSTIVVPREATILDARQILFDTLGVLQNLAVSAASLAVITRN